MAEVDIHSLGELSATPPDKNAFRHAPEEMPDEARHAEASSGMRQIIRFDDRWAW
jgi:hypothetical protein